MSEVYTGQIILFAGNFAPLGFFLCQGQLLPISGQMVALFSVIGSTYGGNGSSNFALPNLNGRAAVSAGQGSGTSSYSLGEIAGEANISLSVDQAGEHTHNLVAVTDYGTDTRGAGNVLATAIGGTKAGQVQATFYSKHISDNIWLLPLSFDSIADAGGYAPHNNMQPYMPIAFCISYMGVFPQSADTASRRSARTQR